MQIKQWIANFVLNSLQKAIFDVIWLGLVWFGRTSVWTNWNELVTEEVDKTIESGTKWVSNVDPSN